MQVVRLAAVNSADLASLAVLGWYLILLYWKAAAASTAAVVATMSSR